MSDDDKGKHVFDTHSEFILEILENPLTRASLDLSMWVANHAPTNDTEDLLLLLTKYVREIALRTVEPELLPMVIAQLQWALAQDDEEVQEKVRPGLKLVRDPVD